MQIFYKHILLNLFIFFSISLFSQSRYTVSGYVKDANTGEDLIGASIYIKDKNIGTVTNHYGFYSLTLNQGKYDMVVSYIGYVEQIHSINLDKNITLNIKLQENTFTMDEVVISGKRPDDNIKSTNVGKFEIPVEKVKTMPAFLGEVDILKTIQLTPGIQSAGEGSSAFYVRGGGPDQNLILLDEAVVYNASHLLGFFSVFNSDALKNVEVTKAGIPSNYGGRLASVLDISMKDGNNREYHADGGIGLISSRLTVQGPVKKDTSAFIISGRRTYMDLMIKPFVKKTSPFKQSSYYFYDLNAKFNYKISEKDRFFISGYFGRDVFDLNANSGTFKNNMSWGNSTATIRWNHLYNSKLFMNTTLIYSDYQFEFDANQQQYYLALFSGVNDYQAKTDFTFLISPINTLKFGADYIYHIFIPGQFTAKSGDVDLDLGEKEKLYSHDFALYANNEIEILPGFKMNGGLRYTFFRQTGPFTRYVQNEKFDIIDTVFYNKGENIKTYNHIEPRLSVQLSINDKSSIKASFTQNYQYIHLVGISTMSLPTDIWVPSSTIVKPQFGTQYSLGYYRNFMSNMYETSIEAYYKTLKNQIEIREGAFIDQAFHNNIDNNFTFGNGESYGVELFINKKAGRITGWIGYTLSWTTRQFPDLNNGKRFFARYDRRHDISYITTFEMNRHWTFSIVWVYATGNTMTIPVSRYFIEGNIINEYGEKNGYRMKPYHRLDLSATYYFKKKKNFESNINFSVYNAYNRYNPYYIYFETTGNINDLKLETKAQQVSLFPILPSITWNFKF